MNIKYKVRVRVTQIKNKYKALTLRIVNRMVKRTLLYRETEKALTNTTAKVFWLEKDNRELAERVTAISQRLVKVAVEICDRPPRRLRLVLDIDPMVIEQGFLHGNDKTVIDYIGRDIGARAAYEIRRANFQRWEI
jgi:hypothetical protein